MTYSTSNIVGRSMLLNLENVRHSISSATERLSSGRRINRGADDPSGLQIGKVFEARVRGLDEAIGGVQKAMNLLDVADKSIDSIQNTLIRMRTIMLRGMNTAVLDDATAFTLFREFWMEANNLFDIVNSAKYNTKDLLTGEEFGDSLSAASPGADLQVGAEAGEIIKIILTDLEENLNTPSEVTLPPGAAPGAFTAAQLSASLGAQFDFLEEDIATAQSARANVASMRARLDGILEDLASERLGAVEARSKLEDADFSHDISELKKEQTLETATESMIQKQMSMDKEYLNDWMSYLDERQVNNLDVAL